MFTTISVAFLGLPALVGAGVSFALGAVAALRPGARARRRARRVARRVQDEVREHERLDRVAEERLERRVLDYEPHARERRLTAIAVEDLKGFVREILLEFNYRAGMGRILDEEEWLLLDLPEPQPR